MKQFALSPRAQGDLDEIWDYSAERWGEAQAKRYIGGIRQALEELAKGERSGRSAERVRAGFQRYSIGSHVIFFRSSQDRIDVVRILHERMDFARQL